MKKLFVLVIVVILGVLVWVAAGPGPRNAEPVPMAAPRAMGAAPPLVDHRPPSAPPVSPLGSVTEPAVATTGNAPIEPAVGTLPVAAAEPPASGFDAPRPMIIPVAGVGPSAMRDMFNEVRGNKRHEAIDILAARGTPVIAADDGVVRKLFTSVPGGLTIYEFDPDSRYCYYYAHLDGYAAGLHEGQAVHRGQVLGYVGTTGNAPKNTPHLHFALIRLDADHRWWKGTYVNPYPLLR